LSGHFAVVPRHGEANGHPVLLSARAFPEITRLTGDEGAGRLLRRRDDVAFIEVDDDGILLDVDQAEDLARLEGRSALLPSPSEEGPGAGLVRKRSDSPTAPAPTPPLKGRG
jgi:hypothetical protein